jgi:hypothetical protein
MEGVPYLEGKLWEGLGEAVNEKNATAWSCDGVSIIYTVHMDMKNKTVIVTGAGSGIGGGIVEAVFIVLGLRLIVSPRGRFGLEAGSKELKAFYADACNIV